MVNNEVRELTKSLERIILEASELYLNNGVQTYKHKSTNDLLTDVDLKMQNYILTKINALYPEVMLYSEEKQNNFLSEKTTVCIDPLDGTCNFSADIPIFGVQMAIFIKKEPVASLIYLPKIRQMFKTIKGEGVTLNGNPIRRKSIIKREDSILLISDFYNSIEIPNNIQYQLVQKLQSAYLKTRLLGASCWDFAMLAIGKANAYVCYYHELWDIAPGLLMVRELGMQTESLTGNFSFGSSSLVVAADKIQIEFIKTTYRQLMNENRQ